MKQVLVIDAPPMLREFIEVKLTAENVQVTLADSRRDAITKLFSDPPQLIIINIEYSIEDILEFLERKQGDANGKKIPVIIAGPVIEKERVADLVQYGVIKYFTQPIKFDLFFEAIGRVLKIAFAIDSTPCVLDIHLNKQIIFVEIARGMNREKLALLRFKISEVIDANKIANPKIILMMTDLELSFVDGLNLELLFDNIIADKRISKRNIKVLSLDSIVEQLIDGHEEYHGIEVASNLAQVMNKLVENELNVTRHDGMQDLISSEILSTSADIKDDALSMRYVPESEDANDGSIFEISSGGSSLSVAIVDDDASVRSVLNGVFQTIGAATSLYTNGSEFLTALLQKKFDLLILDIFMLGMTGFDVLKTLNMKRVSIPTIVYSQAMQKEMIVQALSLGAKSYLLKPQRPENILQKAMEILKTV